VALLGSMSTSTASERVRISDEQELDPPKDDQPAKPSRLLGGLRSLVDRPSKDEAPSKAVGIEELASRRTWSLRALWLAVAMGPLALIGSCLALGRDFPEPPPPVPVTVDVNAGVGGWAENYVATYISADSEQISAVRQFFPDATRLPNNAADLFASRTATIRLEAVADGVYEVLVSVDVLADIVGDDQSYIDAGTRYFTVGVVQVETGFVATSLPSQVAAPPTLSTPNRPLPELSRPDGAAAELSVALEGFFLAYLANEGELARYADLTSGLTRRVARTGRSARHRRLRLATTALHAPRERRKSLGSGGDPARSATPELTNHPPTQGKLQMDFLSEKIDEFQDMAQAFVVLLCIIVIATVGFKSRALVPVLASVLLSGLVIYFTSDAGLTWLPGVIEKETV